ncbi:MAG: histidine kinase [Steroidobacteraceae bacterium]|nr:histidine kinase [Steroidobacteraceae bacterium]
MDSTGSFLIRRERPGFYLPDLCRARSLLAVVLIAELVAVLLTLARHGISAAFWPDLARTSLFLLWTGLGISALLCAFRGVLGRMDVAKGSALAMFLMLLVTALVTGGAWWFAERTHRILGTPPAPLAGHLKFLLANLAVCAIAGGLALRYFYVSHQWRANVEAEAQSRVRALQARIRPHFLFNSMNTIASLTRSDPRLAEQAIADLSDLFRASLREHRERIPLAHEIEIARAYERVERLRLGERLKVDWQIEGLPLDAQVPALILQPLLENAVYHGIEPLDKGGTIRVTGRRDGAMAVITIGNPVEPKLVARRPGHQIGLDNVRQRLELMFRGEADVEVIETPEHFLVTLRFPAGGPPA